MNPIATASLLVIAIAQVLLIVIAWEVPSQQIHFKAVGQYCRELPAVRAQGPEGYFKCVAALAIK